MNAAADTLSTKAEDKVEIARAEPKAGAEDALVELGKVSDTQGGWFGSKADAGMGFAVY